MKAEHLILYCVLLSISFEEGFGAVIRAVTYLEKGYIYQVLIHGRVGHIVGQGTKLYKDVTVMGKG